MKFVSTSIVINNFVREKEGIEQNKIEEFGQWL